MLFEQVDTHCSYTHLGLIGDAHPQFLVAIVVPGFEASPYAILSDLGEGGTEGGAAFLALLFSHRVAVREVETVGRLPE